MANSSVTLTLIPSPMSRRRATAPAAQAPGSAASISTTCAVTSADGGSMTVEMQRNEIEALGIVEGDTVMADLRQAKVFVEDYSI